MKAGVNISDNLNLLRKTKRKFFRNLNENKLFDSRSFWKEIKPYFSDTVTEICLKNHVC